MLTNFLVTTTDDVVANDGEVSLREAIQAANGDSAVSDAPAGEDDGDTISLAQDLAAPIELTEGELAITDDLIISGQGQTIRPTDSRAFRIDMDEEVLLRNLNLAGGTTSDHGGLIAIHDGGITRLHSVTVRDGLAEAGGGGLYNGGATVIIRGSRFMNNRAVGAGTHIKGGAIYNDAGGVLRVTDTVVDNNVSSHGDGAGIYDNSGMGETLILRGVRLTDNVGNGLYIDGSRAQLIDCSILGNGARGLRSVDSTVAISRSTIASNRGIGTSGSGDNGGIWNTGGVLVVDRTRIVNNLGIRGGGIYNIDGHVEVVESLIARNGAFGGGGIYSQRGSVGIIRSTISSNFADVDFAGGIFVQNALFQMRDSRVVNNKAREGQQDFVGKVGGIVLAGKDTVADIRDSLIRGNWGGSVGGGLARFGGSLRITGSVISRNGAFNRGGGIFNNNQLDRIGEVTILNSIIYGNAARHNRGIGGGIFSVGNDVRLHHSVIRSNFAGAKGGGIHLIGKTLVISGNSRIAGNVAGRPTSPIQGDGGGLYAQDGAVTVRIFDSHFVDNRASNEGGGMWLGEGNRVVLVRSRIVGNRAYGFQGGLGGGGLIGFAPALLIVDSEFARNDTNRHGAGMLLGVNTTARIVRGRVDNNHADGWGGAIFNHGELDLEEVLVRFNTARAGGGIYTGAPGVTRLGDSTVSANLPNNFAGPGLVV